MDYALMWLILALCITVAIIVVILMLLVWTLRAHLPLVVTQFRTQDCRADHLASAAEELNYPEYPILSLDVPFGAPAPVSVELRLLQMTHDQPYCPVCVILRCTQFGIPVERILPLLHGPHLYCDDHANVLLAISGEWSYGPSLGPEV